MSLLSMFTTGDDPQESVSEASSGEVQAGEVQAGEVQAGEVQAGEVQAGEVQAHGVQRLAALNRLRFSEEEAQEVAEELACILGYVRQLDEVDTAGVEPMQQPTVLRASKPLRPDEARQRISRREALENAPDVSDDGHFRAPSAME